MQARFKRFTALILSVLMVLTCMPLSAMAEDAAIPAEDISVEVIPEDAEAVPEQEAATVMDAEASEPEGDPVRKTVQEMETPQEEVPQEESAMQSEETQPAEAAEEPMPVEEIPVEEPAAEAPAETEQEAEKPAPDDRHPLQAAIDTYGHIYVATVRQTDVFGNAKLDADTLVFSTTNDVFLLLATKFTDEKTVKVWFMDSDGNVVSGFVSVKNLDEKYLLDEDIKDVSFLPAAQGETAIGMMSLFLVNGSYPAAETDAQIVEEPADTSSEEEEPVSTETEEPVETDPSETELPAEPTEDEPLTETDPTEQPASEEEASADVSQETVQEEPVADPETTENPEESTEPQEAPSTEADPLEGVSENPDEPAYEAAGSYIAVTTKTRVFAGMDAQAAETYYSGEYLGNFVKDATVQILTVDFDEAGHVWYQVRFLYGDDFKDGTMKWTDYATCWILSDETSESAEEGCTVTDFAYTLEYLQQTRNSGRRMLKASPMNGFSLKNINGRVSGFYAWQSGLYGSSGKDSDYPQLAKSAAHGTIYATPHYLEGFTVFCLEHNLSGPGEGSGKNQSAKGPYVLVDMDTFVTNSAYGGTTGVRYKASTMHALGWVLRHTYPFMALNRSDSNNEVWSRVAGQFAMREVIKQLEGSQYVRNYWNMDNFYSFSGGAPAVYLEYARWLASNGIARAKITGNITASNQSLSVSGSSYIGTVKLTTDADLIRISKSAGTITGNSGGADSSYYYVKSGDTIKITSSQSKFSVPMPGQEQVINSLASGVRDLLTLVSTRLLCAMDEPFVYDETNITVACAGREFKLKGKKVLQMGWQRIWQAFSGSIGGRAPEENDEKIGTLPDDLKEGDEIALPRAELAEGKTTPPAHHTEDTILHAMETAGAEDMPDDAEHKGIGTPATRASILEKLLETKLIERTGDQRKRILTPTAKGKALASVLPAKLMSAQLTAEWEQRLKRIEKGEEKPEAFMEDVRAFVRDLTKDTTRAENADQLFQPMRQVICKCPKCGAAVTDRPKGFMCENRICGFALWKTGGILTGAEHPLTASDVKALVEKGSVHKTGLLSAKSHIRYEATLHLDYKDGKTFLRPTFDKQGGK